jgi:hypothetical protein
MQRLLLIALRCARRALAVLEGHPAPIGAIDFAAMLLLLWL